MESAQPLSMFLFNSLLPRVDLSTPDGRAQLRINWVSSTIASLKN